MDVFAGAWYFRHYEAYIGAVEAQGGVHCISHDWLVEGCPTADRIRELLKRRHFRAKLVRFIPFYHQVDIGGANAEQVRAMNERSGFLFEGL